MTETRFDVVGLGNAIVDVIARAEEDLLESQDLPKGGMTLVDAERAESLYRAMGPGVESSGGSAANTLAGLASLGGRSAFIGRVRDDQLGGIFRHDMRATGVAFDTPAATAGPATGRCLVFVTPDAQRTMATYLGISPELDDGAVDPDLVASSRVTYLEGYLWDRPAAQAAFVQAARAAHAAGRQVALSLSDPFCVERHRKTLKALAEDHVDLLFANEVEICSLYQVGRFEEAVEAVVETCRSTSRTVVLTRSEKGALGIRDGRVSEIPAAPIEGLVDTTGAGDLFAAGFLYGHTRDWPLAASLELGALAAAEIIQHYGPRPEAPLAPLVERVAAKAAG